VREAVKRIVFAVVCAFSCAGGGTAAPIVSGTVTARNGTALAEVQVQVEIRSVKTVPPTDAQGRFEFDATTLFSAAELRDAGGLMLKFSKPGFQPANKLLRLLPSQAPAPVAMQLDPSGGSAALAPDEKQSLDKYVAAPGSAPLFLIPYALSGVEASDPKKVNEVLRANLERVIVTHVQASAAAGSAAVSLKLLPMPDAGDIDRMRAYGAYLNALAVISGFGEVEAAAGKKSTLDVSSTFLVVSQGDLIGAPVLYVDDQLPANQVSSPRLYQHLSKLWGRSAVLALGVSDFRKASASKDKDALKRIRKYLQSERAGTGPGDEALLSQLNVLIEAVDKELAK
jgi:hypothetical protein